MIHNQSITERHLYHIADMIVLNGTLTECPGLVHGKSGISVFLFHYALYTGNELFEEYAVDLIEEIRSQIHNNSPADYEKGIAGIGVSIDYLIQNDFITSVDDIFEDFDQKMYRAVMYDPFQDFTLYDGLTGYGRYWMKRLHQKDSAVLAKECLLHIVQHIKERIKSISEKEKLDVFSFLFDLQKTYGFEICSTLMKQCSNGICNH